MLIQRQQRGEQIPILPLPRRFSDIPPAPMPPSLTIFLPLFLQTLIGTLVSPELVLESGYFVSTVLDFNKPLPSGVNDSAVRPFALLPLTQSSNILILLDSTHSAFFSLELPISQGSIVKLLSGKGTAGFSDGDPTSAMFNRPRNFAVDSNDNIYVADRINHVIRKISRSSGMTSTIAGGFSRKAGHIDGPAQNATFSEDFDLLYMHKTCSLLISDRGSGVIRQMDLKTEDCEGKPRPKNGLGAAPVTIIVFVALFCGIAFGFIVRPFVTSRSSQASMNHWFLHLRKHFQSTWSKPLPILFSGIRSVVANSETPRLLFLRLVNSCLGHLRIMFRNIRLEKPVHGKKVLLVQKISDERKDLIDFEEESSLLDSSSSSSSLTNQPVEMGDSSSVMYLPEVEDDHNLVGKIDNMMVSNLFDFATSRSKRQCLIKRISVHDLSH